MKPCAGCRLEWPVIMSPEGTFHAVPLAKSPVGRRWLAAGMPPCLYELIDCTRPRGPVLTLLQGGLP